jgi:hypothetical protein
MVHRRAVHPAPVAIPIPHRKATMTLTPTSPLRPVLLLDIDGVFNPHPKRPKRPEGYLTRKLRMPSYRSGRADLTTWYNPAHGELLREFAAIFDVELVWAAQGWYREANTHYGPLLGLPDLAVIAFPEPFDFRRWKFDAVTAHVGQRPLAWLDDDFDEAAPGALKEFHQARAGISTALISVDGRHGINEGHFEQLRQWALSLSEVRT